MDNEVQRQREITRDLDGYIASKRQNSWFGFLKRSEGPVSMAADDEPIPDEPVPDDEPRPEQPSVVEESMDEMPRRGFWSRIFGSEEPVESVIEEESADVEDADLKEVARITLGFLRMSDPETLTRIKASPDFDTFKEILRKRQIIK